MRSTSSILIGFCLACVLVVPPCMAQSQVPKIIAHRGASGYCVEHSEAAKTLAHAQKADYIEQDVVLTKDRIFVVSHDITMDSTTNVKDIYPTRQRADGKYYFVDFTWEELRRISLQPRPESNRKGDTAFSSPGIACAQRLLRLEDEIRLLRSLDNAFGRRTGLYIELKSPSFHRKELGISMGEHLLATLRAQGVESDRDSCLIQSFEDEELIDLHRRLQSPYKLIQLLGGRADSVDLNAISRYAYGIGPSLAMVARRTDEGVESTGLVEKAKQLGLQVHPYTVRRDQQPAWSQSLDQTHSILVHQLHVDGFFTDFPDLGKQAVTPTPLP